MKSVRMLSVLYALVICIPAFGQIVIDWTEIPNAANSRWSKNIAYEQAVSLGSAGGPHTWTFTSQPMGTDSCVNVIVPCWQTPFWDSFPSANLCYMSVEGPDTALLYMHLAQSYLANLGFVGQDSAGGYFQKYLPPDTNNLPEQFGDYRRYATSWYVILDASTYVRYQKRGLEYINAYGTVNVPYGSFPCLRYILWDTLIQTVYYNSVPVFSDTANRIGHQFVAEHRSGVVCVFSHENETNPYFSSAAVLERMTYFYGGVEEADGRPPADAGITCSPNPFRRATRISAGIRDEGSGVSIYDISGRMVRFFAPGPMPLVPSAGRESSPIIGGTLCWNGTDEEGRPVPKGVYFVRVMSGGRAATEKIIKTE